MVKSSSTKFGVRRVKMDDIKVVKHGGRYTVTYQSTLHSCTKGRGAKMVTIQSQNFGVEIEMTGVSAEQPPPSSPTTSVSAVSTLQVAPTRRTGQG